MTTGDQHCVFSIKTSKNEYIIRMTSIKQKDKFLNRIFTQEEIKYCESKRTPAIHFAGRFAGKEAIKKAILSSGLLKRISMKDIEIISVKNIPRVSIQSLNNYIELSISHIEEFATATAIIMK